MRVAGRHPAALSDTIQFRQRAGSPSGGAATVTLPENSRSGPMKKIVSILALLFAAGAGSAAYAQAGDAVKEAGKATAETAKQGTENVKGAMSSEPEKTVHKAKAKVHKAKAKQHGRNAKAAAKETVQ